VGETDGAALSLSLRRAIPADVKLLRVWDRKPHVDAASGEDGEFDWEAEVPRSVPWRDIFIAEEQGRPIGVLVIIDPAEEETHYWGEIGADLRAIDIWIGDEANLGKGYGTQMMKLAIAHCFREPQVKAIIVDPLVSNTNAHRFYERLGFRKIDRRIFSGVDDCFVYRLNRETSPPAAEG
jgi:aminoglycoside 6'-N-acetyltransferase